MNKIVSKKSTSAIFLAIVLVTGTIALSSPSFMIGAKAQPYYGMDNNDKKSYGSDSYYESQYSSSYKPDYKPKYSSYGKDDRDKSKDSKKSVSINKLKCINTNLNINGNNTGDINVGNTGQGYLGVSSSVGGGYGDDGYSKQVKGFECIINNNNTNTNVVAVGGGNATDGSVTDTCEECFRTFLTAGQISAFLALQNFLVIDQFCELAEPGNLAEGTVRALLGQAGVSPDVIDALIACLADVGIEFA